MPLGTNRSQKRKPMASNAIAEGVAEALDEDPIRLTSDGRIIDFLNPDTTRANKPEERVRQKFARKLHYDYGYDKELMVLEAPIHIGSKNAFADIAIYHSKNDAKRRNQSKISLIVETKAPTIRQGQKQLASYIFATAADGGVWVNDTNTPHYFRRQDVPGNDLVPWPNIPRHGLDWESVGKHKKSSLRTPHDLVETFRRCHNTLYVVGIDSADIAMDMVRIILAKYRDETNEGETCEFRCTPLESQSEAGRRRVASRVRKLFRQVRDDDPDVFDPQEEIGAGDREIVTIVPELQDFRFVPDEESDHTFDVVGAAYEVYVGSHLKGDRGQYFTPRLVVQLLVRMLNPSEDDIILDPAMGSGGFLVAAMRHVIREISVSARKTRAKNQAIQRARSRLFGVDKSPKLVKIAKTNMILASDGHAGLIHGDTLEPIDLLPPDFSRKAGVGKPTIILTNPPFGATSEHRISHERYPELLSQFDLGRVWAKAKNGHLRVTDDLIGGGVPPEYLFLERCLRWLSPGGKLGIVVPRGVLTNSEALPARTLLFREARVFAVVNCHDDTFKPHTDAKASLILCERKPHPTENDDDYPIFMAVSQAIGHTTLGHPVYKKTSSGEDVKENGRAVIDEDLTDIKNAWVKYQQGDSTFATADCFLTSRHQITKELNLNPTLYLPRLVESRARAIEIGESQGWRTARLGEIADVYSGPRFTRPYADRGVTSGPGIVRYFTGNAATQTRGENIKFLDLNKANTTQRRMIEQLWLRRGMILVTRSGTTGRVVYATSYHDGAIGTEDLNRVVIQDEALRGYVYQFLLSRMGQDQLKRNVTGGIVDHVEPHQLRDILVPIPIDHSVIESVGLPIIQSVEMQEATHAMLHIAECRLEELLSPKTGGQADLGEKARRWDAFLDEWRAIPMDPAEAKLMDGVVMELHKEKVRIKNSEVN